MAAPRVSVVIPVYARQRALDHALASLASEEAHIHDITIVDDASPEPMVARPPGVLAGRTQLVRLDVNVGASAARQIGIDRGRGDLVAFLDSDDAWLPGKLAAQIALLEGHAGGDAALLAVATGWQALDLERRRTSARMPLPSASPVDFASGCWFCPGSTVLLRRSAFTVVGPFDPALRRLEDIDWFLRFALAGGRLAVADTVGAVIRRGTGRDRAAVEAASMRLSAKFTQPREVRRALLAWLEVERAAAAHANHDVAAAMAHMLRSLMLRPRLRLQMRDWWRTGEPPLALASACRLLGLDQGEG